jgi:RNA polymerase sigma-B factor
MAAATHAPPGPRRAARASLAVARPATSSRTATEIRAREERALFARLAADRNDKHAREALIARFMPLARSLALRYQRSGEPIDDLLQVASLGLIKAIDGFDTGREYAFCSYAVPTILGEIKRHFRDRTWTVRVPRGLQELTLRVDRTVSDLSEKLHRQPSVGEIADALGADEEEVLEALQAKGAYSALSFDAPQGAGAAADRPQTLGETLGVAEDGFEQAEQRAMVDAMLSTLRPVERDILRMRFEHEMTQAEIGAVIGVSQMQVSRTIRAALQRLQPIAEQAREAAALGAR